MSTNIGKYISKSLGDKYTQKPLGLAKLSATNGLKTTLKTIMQKTGDTIIDLTGNKEVDKNIKGSRSSPQNSSETVASKTENIGFDREIPKE